MDPHCKLKMRRTQALEWGKIALRRNKSQTKWSSLQAHKSQRDKGSSHQNFRRHRKIDFLEARWRKKYSWGSSPKHSSTDYQSGVYEAMRRVEVKQVLPGPESHDERGRDKKFLEIPPKTDEEVARLRERERDSKRLSYHKDRAERLARLTKPKRTRMLKNEQVPVKKKNKPDTVESERVQ